MHHCATPLGVDVNQQNKVKNSGDVLLALREARGIRIEGDLENMCSCDMQTPWEAWQEIWTDKKEDKEARLAAAGSAGAESEFAAENGNARVAGLKLSAYERMIAGCVKARRGVRFLFE